MNQQSAESVQLPLLRIIYEFCYTYILSTIIVIFAACVNFLLKYGFELSIIGGYILHVISTPALMAAPSFMCSLPAAKRMKANSWLSTDALKVFMVGAVTVGLLSFVWAWLADPATKFSIFASDELALAVLAAAAFCAGVVAFALAALIFGDLTN